MWFSFNNDFNSEDYHRNIIVVDKTQWKSVDKTTESIDVIFVLGNASVSTNVIIPNKFKLERPIFSDFFLSRSFFLFEIKIIIGTQMANLDINWHFQML